MLELRLPSIAQPCKKVHTNLGADDFFPVFTYVIIRSSLRHPQTTVSLLQHLVDLDDADHYLPAQSAFCITNLEAALSYILELEVPLDIRLNKAGGGGYARVGGMCFCFWYTVLGRAG